MRINFKSVIIGAVMLLPSIASAQSLRGEIEQVVRDYLSKNPEEVQRIVRDTLSKNPELLQEMLVQLLKKGQGNNVAAAPPSRPDKSADIKANAEALFSSPRQVTLGNPQGDVTLVEFFDYNCGFCKRALADKLALLKSDPKLRIVLKELPILGQGSVEAAKVAVALRMQDGKGERYAVFHQKLLGDRGPADRAQAIEAAREAGADMARLEADMGSDEIDKTLSENMGLARLLGINGTPSYVVGDQVVAGAVGQAALSERIRLARRPLP